MLNCPNCAAPIEPYKCKCEYCGTYYYDLTVFDMEENKPCYIKLKTDIGTLTALAIPQLGTLEIVQDNIDWTEEKGAVISRFVRSLQCEINIKFICIANPDNEK